MHEKDMIYAPLKECIKNIQVNVSALYGVVSRLEMNGEIKSYAIMIGRLLSIIEQKTSELDKLIEERRNSE